jgi:tRNA pseudouridine55 synthase
MATGVLVLGIGRATRLLGHVSLHSREYDATVRLGATTVTDGAEGEVLELRDASVVSNEALAATKRRLTGALAQVPSSALAARSTACGPMRGSVPGRPWS